MKNKWGIGIALFLLLDAVACFYFFGRSVWSPVYTRIMGGKTATEVVRQIQQKRPETIPAVIGLESLTLIGLKEEQVLEVWGHRPNHPPQQITAYPFTGYSGTLGPKLREGDRQIPEGLYQIEYLNPNSSYHLSMKLNYPNKFDREKGKQDERSRLGYDIFIHGKSVTIGCIPIGDSAIEELFAMVAEIGVEKTSVILSPYDMRVQSKDLDILEIDWEQELYPQIKKALMAFANH